MRRKILSCLLMLALLLGLGAPAASADREDVRVVLGADLSEEQILSVYEQFGLQRGSVPELTLTNAEEREALQGLVEDSVIGTRAISCVYLELRPEGSGLELSTSNISWCTREQYENALTTAGITDARVMVAAPFAVSGTAALTGMFKAYEDITGSRLDETSKEVGTEELTITGTLADELGENSVALVNELKLMLDVTRTMSDGQLRDTINELAGGYGLQLTDSQLQQLIRLCRSLEKLDASELKTRAEQLRRTVQKVSEAKDQVVGFAANVRRVISSIAEFFGRLRALFGE